MASRDARDTPSPTASSIRLPLGPLGRRSRRTSRASTSSKTRVDKETLNQALDEIHSSASRSDALTTFDEFAAPPSNAQGPDHKTIASDIVHGGLSGLYGRFRASVENAREALGGSSPVAAAENTESSLGNLPSKAPPRASRPSTSSSQPSNAITSASSSKLSSPLVSSFAETQRMNNGPSDKPNSTSSSRTSAIGARPPLVVQKSKPSIATIHVEPLEFNTARTDERQIQSPASAQSTSQANLTYDGTSGNRESSRARAHRDNQQPFRPNTRKGEAITRRGIVASDTTGDDDDSGDEGIPVGSERKGSRPSDTLPAGAEDDGRVSQSGASGTISNHHSHIATTHVSSATGTADRTTATQASTATRPPLLQISQSHLPGYRPSRASSSDGGLSSSTVVAPSRPPTVHEVPEPNYINNQSNANTNTENLPNNVFSQMRRRVLSKEFWMRDENAKDCFYCGDPFSTFRRKHHCRTCGQIFDSKCTSLISGKLFGQPGSLRVCKPCEAIIHGNDDDSSEYSDDADDSSYYEVEDRNAAMLQGDQQSKLGTPTISIPMSRKPGGGKRRSAVIELDTSPTLARPSSSRSLRSLSGRPRSSTGHKRHLSKHQHMRNVRYDDRAPFHRHAPKDSDDRLKLPAFHHDNIIDPELAPFMSDDDSSEDDQVSIFATLSGQGAQHNDAERGPFGSGLIGPRKTRSRGGDRSVGAGPLGNLHSRDPDNASITSRHLNRHSRRRNISVSSGIQKASPKRTKSSGLLKNLAMGFSGALSPSPVSLQVPNQPLGGSRMTRSASMLGAGAPVVELNAVSLQHVRRLLKQLLQDGTVPHVSSWEKALLPILLQCTDDVNPDVQHSDDIDIRHYIKLKKVPGGRPGDTSYVSGVVFSKNLALKSMSRSIPNPRIIIVTFAIEYARHHQHFMSLEPVIAQEREYLRNLVNRIAALRPHVLLVQRNVAGLALQFLEEAGIAVAYNVKPSVLNAVARCTRTRMVSSVDKLAGDNAILGYCESFDVKTYMYRGVKKTYTYISGCQRELGCTIVLRGADVQHLRTLKKITEFMCYVVYNLKLETCLMRDECVSIPSSVDGGTLSPGRDITKKTAEGEQIEAADPADTIAQATQKLHTELGTEVPSVKALGEVADGIEAPKDSEKPGIPDKHSPELQPQPGNLTNGNNQEHPIDNSVTSFYGEMVEKHRTKIISASPFVTFSQPYLLMQAREQERKIAYLKRLRDHYTPATEAEEARPMQSFKLIQPEMVHEVPEKASRQVRDFLHAVHNAEYEKAMHNYNTQKRQWEAYVAGNVDLFDPFHHQKIAVLYSAVNTVTSTPCFGPEVIALGFYHEHDLEEGFLPDCSLGQYIEDLCQGANGICESAGCDRKMFDHHRQYVHGEGQLSVFVQKHPSKIRGLQNTVLMWSKCRICEHETQPFPMSENSWKYSFAKYLELTFWSSQLHPRADRTNGCTHDIHKDHIRYFGLNNVALRFQYDRVHLYEVIVPRPTVSWKVDSDLRLKNDQFRKFEDRLDRFYASVKARLKGIHTDSIVPEKFEACRLEIENLSKRANDEHEWLKKKLQEKYMSSEYYEIIPLNRAVRAIVERAIGWDDAFGDFERQYFPSEKDIRRLAALQLKKMFLERDESVGSLSTVGEETGDPSTDGALSMNEKEGLMPLTPMPSQMSPERARDMLTSVVEEDHNKDSDDLPTPMADGSHSEKMSEEASNLLSTKHDGDVRHLDLAVPPMSPRANSVDDITPKPSPSALARDDVQPVLREASPEPQRSSFDGPTNEVPPSSRIPRPVELTKKARPQLLNRSQSQPGVLETLSGLASHNSLALPSSTQTRTESSRSTLADSAKALEKRVSERLGLGTFKSSKSSSLIPRSIPSKRDSRVSTLAKHFEQLSREFEKERLRERRQRVEKFRHARAYQLASSKPVVEVYRDVHEAAQEQGPTDEELQAATPPRLSTDTSTLTDSGVTETTAPTTGTQSPNDDHVHGDATEDLIEQKKSDDTSESLHTVETAEGDASDADIGIIDDADLPGTLDDPNILSPSEVSLELLPKHEKTSLMKMLTSFWSERSASGWSPLEYPFLPTEHVWGDSDIIVREDEPSSIIALALSSPDYTAKMQSFRAQQQKSGGGGFFMDNEASVESNLLHQANTNIRYSFTNRGVRAQCKIFYAQSFDALRRKCGVADRFVESMSRCLKWDSKGGKSKSIFLRTLDDRFILKSLSTIEVNAFFRFAPNYFAFTHQNLFKGLPSVIAKMFGLFQIQIKTSSGRDFDCFMLVMENLFYDREPNRRFDLKGSMRNRKIQSTGERDEVLLDENLVDIIYSETPIFVREHTKKLLKASVWNDTLFLSKQNVMDYSLMAGFDDTRREIVVGIIDCIRTYTWDKKLETWIKDRGKNKPTITSPKDYRNRFRIAMAKYILQAPSCWHQFSPALQITKKPVRLEAKGASATDAERATGMVREANPDREEQEGLEMDPEAQTVALGAM